MASQPISVISRRTCWIRENCLTIGHTGNWIRRPVCSSWVGVLRPGAPWPQRNLLSLLFHVNIHIHRTIRPNCLSNPTNIKSQWLQRILFCHLPLKLSVSSVQGKASRFRTHQLKDWFQAGLIIFHDLQSVVITYTCSLHRRKKLVKED